MRLLHDGTGTECNWYTMGLDTMQLLHDGTGTQCNWYTMGWDTMDLVHIGMEACLQCSSPIVPEPHENGTQRD